MGRGHLSKNQNMGGNVISEQFVLPCGKIYVSRNIGMVNKLVKLHSDKCKLCSSARTVIRDSELRHIKH